MNITDSLENHRKNLYNFYLACNILGNTNANKKNFSSITQHEDLDINDSAGSSSTPLFTFADLSTSETISEISQSSNKVASRENAATENKSNSVTVICDERSRFEEDAKDNEEYEVKENVESPLNSENEKIYFHCKSLVSDGEESLCEPSREPRLKIKIFDEKKWSESDTSHERSENEETKYVKHSQHCRDGNSSQVLDASPSVVKQDFDISRNMILLEDQFSCNHCKKLFRHQSSFFRHATKCLDRGRVNDVKKSMKPVKKWTKSSKIDKTCKICGHVARKPCELKMHLSKHTGENPFVCKACGIGFSSTSKLNRHIRNEMHTNGKLYCELCKIYFTLEANYVRHKSEHTLPVVKMKPFACSKCDKRFSRLDTLKKHMEVHRQEDREFFECMACEGKFSRKDTLSRHITGMKCSNGRRKRQRLEKTE